jgi:hypothetical protein
MGNNIKTFVKSAILNLITNTSSDEKVAKLVKTHNVKIHFIPTRYRIFSGLLQSMNIQFGNFIEKLLHEIVKNEEGLNINANSSKKMELPLTEKSNKLIDKYITNCQNNNFNEIQLLKNFNTLIDSCLSIESYHDVKDISIKHDIDVLFSNQNDEIFYLEVKYNDDHDTGKYADINRKFLKSYIGISNILKIYDRNKFKPILYYLTQKKLKGNIYLPEEENIYRGDKLFVEFFTINYQDLDSLMNSIGDDSDIVKLFDDLHHKIRFDLQL